MKYLLFLITSALIFCFASCAPLSNTNYNDAPRKPGSCYMKCLLPPTYNKRSIQVPVYTGSDIEIEKAYVRDTTVTYSTASDTLRVLKIDRYLLDKTITDDYRMKSITIDSTINEPATTGWVEILCETNVTRSVISKIQEKLITTGYLEIPKPTGKFDEFTKSAIVSYQKANDLKVGMLSIEMLQHMGLRG